MKAIIDDKIPFIFGKIERIIPQTTYISGEKITRKTIIDARADILIIRTRTHCDEALLHDTPVRLIITATIGYDHIDTQWCESAGIEWHNCPGCNANSVATYIKNTLLCLERTIQTIGIIGLGHVGSKVRQNAILAGYQVLCYDPYLHIDQLDQIRQQADVITFHVPLTHSGEYPTYHFADQTFLRSLQRKPIIINTSRGGVIDEQALLQALDEGQVSGTVIDTWENEPHINLQLLQQSLIATPHIAGYSVNGKWNATKMVLQYLEESLKSSRVPEFQSSNHPHLTSNLNNPIIRLSDYPPIPSDLPSLTPKTLLSDSNLLKQHPQQFESFRSNYPKRKE